MLNANSSPTCFDIGPPMCQRVCMMKGQRRDCVVGPMLNAYSGPTYFDIGPPMGQRVCMMKGQRKNCVVGPMLIAYSGPMLAQQSDHIGPTLSQHVGAMKARWANYRWPNVILQQWPNISCTVGPTMALLHIAIWVIGCQTGSIVRYDVLWLMSSSCRTCEYCKGCEPKENICRKIGVEVLKLWKIHNLS